MLIRSEKPASGSQQGNLDGQVDDLGSCGTSVLPHVEAGAPICEERVHDLFENPVTALDRGVRVD